MWNLGVMSPGMACLALIGVLVFMGFALVKMGIVSIDITLDDDPDKPEDNDGEEKK